MISGGFDVKITDIKAQNRKALYMLLHVDELRRSYTDMQQSMTFLSASNLDGMPHGSDVGKPTEGKAMKLIDLEKKKNWIISIEQMEQTLSPSKLAFLQFRRDAEAANEKGRKDACRPGWRAYVQSHYTEWASRNLGHKHVEPITDATMKEWQREIVDVTVRMGIFHHCFDY